MTQEDAIKVTRDVEPATLPDLLERPPRATITFVEHDVVDLLPAQAHFAAGTHSFGVSTERSPDLENREVVLVIDDGQYWFELRGISVRGVAKRVDASGTQRTQHLTWYRIEARRVLAWNYASIREE